MHSFVNGAQTDEIARDARRKATGDILNKLTLLAVSVGLVALGASIYRVTRFGWNSNVVSDLGASLVVISLLSLRRTLPLRVVVPSLVIAFGALAALNYLTSGLVAIGPIMFVTVCILAWVFYGQLWGFIALGISLVVLAAIAAADVSGALPRHQNIEEYVHSTEAWVSHLAGGTLYIMATLVAVGSVQDHLIEALRRLHAGSSELEKREEKYRLLSQTMRDVSFVQDLGLRFTFASPSVQTVLGHTPEEFLELGFDDLMTPESSLRAKRDFEESLSRAREHLPDMPLLEYEYVRKDGASFWGEVQMSFIRDASGDVAGLQGVLRDVSDRKAAQEENAVLSEQLRQSEKLRAIGQLAGGIAHDFNNQLSGILAYADLIHTQYASDPRLTSYSEGILVAARRANDLTDKLLDYARKEPARSMTFDLHALIGEVVGILYHSLGKNIVIETALEASAPTLRGDPTQIQSALLNLALNARDAMPGGGTIEIRTTNQEDASHRTSSLGGEQNHSAVLLTVSDTGSGIDEEILPRVFEPFFTTKSAGRGTGMGLATVHSAVEAHGGAISVSSEAGAGTRFFISLPTVTAAKAEREPQKAVGVCAPKNGRVLLVDDEAIVRRTAALMLEQLGYRVTVASNADEAIRSFGSDAFSVVLLDMVLPGRNGLEIYAALKQIDPAVRVIFMSGYSAGLDAGELIEKNRIPFLAKPFSFADLENCIVNAMDLNA